MTTTPKDPVDALMAPHMELASKYALACVAQDSDAIDDAWDALEASARALAAVPAAEIKYKPGEWFDATSVDLMEAFYNSRLPAIREAARVYGYAIGVHGSLRRDLDLIAAPWRDGASDADTLAAAIHHAACGFTSAKYQWEQKPAGRLAVSMPVCWTHRHGVLSDGHIDLSVCPPIARQAGGVPAQVKPDGRLHADGYFTWNKGKRPDYIADRGLPCDFYVAAPSPSAVQPTAFLPGEYERMTENGAKAWAGVDPQELRGAVQPLSEAPQFDHAALFVAMDLASLLAGSVGMNDIPKSRGYSNDLRAHLSRFIVTKESST